MSRLIRKEHDHIDQPHQAHWPVDPHGRRTQVMVGLWLLIAVLPIVGALVTGDLAFLWWATPAVVMAPLLLKARPTQTNLGDRSLEGLLDQLAGDRAAILSDSSDRIANVVRVQDVLDALDGRHAPSPLLTVLGPTVFSAAWVITTTVLWLDGASSLAIGASALLTVGAISASGLLLKKEGERRREIRTLEWELEQIYEGHRKEHGGDDLG